MCLDRLGRSLSELLATVAMLKERGIALLSLEEQIDTKSAGRFRRAVEEDPSQPLYITEICKTIRVSDTTLEVCCQEQLGIGPKRYLLLRRLHLARRALREASRGATTVTDIATRYGFWHFGRFAGEYRSLFGESPSATLRRQSE